jgi:hypothetical protein
VVQGKNQPGEGHGSCSVGRQFSYRSPGCLFLADWLNHHIKEDDMAMINYVRSRLPVGSAGLATL